MGKNYSLGPGDGFFIDCRVPHLYRTEGDVWKHGVFHLNGPLVPALFSRYMENGSVSFYQPFTGNYQKKLEELLSIYGSVQPCRDWLASDCISSILTDLLRNASEEKETDSPVPENLRYLISYMEKHFTQALTCLLYTSTIDFSLPSALPRRAADCIRHKGCRNSSP